MDLDRLKESLKEERGRVDGIIRSSLASDITLLNTTNDALLSNAGKKMRPLLSILVAKACAGAANEDTLHFAAAVELLHNATLLHDDVADESSERRGAPTVRSLLGPSASVLLGDFWLVKALDNLLLSSEHGLEAVKICSKTLGDLAEGEMLQLEKANSCDTVFDDYLRIIFCKTASLFVAAADLAAMSVGAGAEARAAVVEYARLLGLAFQMKDDIFDYSTDASIGKPVGIDLKEHKITLPLLCALDNVEDGEKETIRSLVRGIPEDGHAEDKVRAFVKDNDGILKASDMMDVYIGRAIAALQVLPPSEDREFLEMLARHVGDRKK